MEASRSYPLPQAARTDEDPSPAITTEAGTPAVPGLRSRRAIGVAVVVGVMLLQCAADVVAARETARILARMAFMSCELPLLMLALSMAFGWSLRRKMTAGKGLLAGVGIATAFGCVFGILYGLVALKVPDLRLHLAAAGSDTVVVLRSSLFGVLNAQMYFGLWALAVVYPFAVEGARVRDLEAQQLRSETEVTRLRAHLEPHFLLNTLNAIAGLVTEEPREARRLLVCLGDLLRDAVQESGDLQTLEKQVAWLRRYAQILEARHRGALSFEWEVAKDCETELVPRLLLQPLVENAVQHGALQRTDRAGQVVVRASRKADGTLVCTVEDNGPGVPDSDVRAGAFGLQAVRRRIELEAPEASLRLESSSQGTRSIVELPRRVTPG
ncbi:MAG TPA: histidine kinase [Polyangiaceae bacterium]|jgi:signal transduction histidine kinase